MYARLVDDLERKSKKIIPLLSRLIGTFPHCIAEIHTILVTN